MIRKLEVIALAGLAAFSLAAGADHKHFHGKTTAGVSYASSAIYKARIGETVSVPLAFDVPANADSVRAELHTGEGLLLSGESRRLAAGPAQGTRVTMADATVTVLAEGRHYLGFTVFVTRDGVERFRSYSVALEAGDSRARKAKTEGRIETDASGRAVHVLEADETR